ncbi:hypothetical protein EDB84DRAFT_1441417 [Lactarius hengduanensis]|nr:hypothetical protein EDB84DRAFT_1441417 [Lactarius hengduanensis]
MNDSHAQTTDLRNCFGTSRWRKVVRSGECIDQAGSQSASGSTSPFHVHPLFDALLRATGKTKVDVVLLSSHKCSNPICASIRDPFAGAVHRRLTRIAGVRRRCTQRRNFAAHLEGVIGSSKSTITRASWFFVPCGGVNELREREKTLLQLQGDRKDRAAHEPRMRQELEMLVAMRHSVMSGAHQGRRERSILGRGLVVELSYDRLSK